MKKWLVLAGTNGAIGVMAAAYGAHGLIGGSAVMEPEVFDTAVRMQLWHALALLGVQRLEDRRPTFVTTIAGYAFTAGIVLFCGSTYLTGITGNHGFATLAPYGGILLVLGWCSLIWIGSPAGRQKTYDDS